MERAYIFVRVCVPGVCQSSNLRLALMLQPMLLAAGHSVRLSRERDIALTLEQCVTLAWAWGADLLISLHCDSSAGPKPQSYQFCRFVHCPRTKLSAKSRNFLFLLPRSTSNDVRPQVGVVTSREPVQSRKLPLPDNLWFACRNLFRHQVHLKRDCCMHH